MLLLFFANQSTGSGPIIIADTVSGGFFYDIDSYASSVRRRIEREQNELEEAEAIADKVDREIASLLHKQEAESAERKDFERLSKLAHQFANQSDAGFSNRIDKAIARVNATQSAAAMAKLQFEIERALREEEQALIALLNQ